MRVLHAHTPSSCPLHQGLAGAAFGPRIFPFWLWQQEKPTVIHPQQQDQWVWSWAQTAASQIRPSSIPGGLCPKPGSHLHPDTGQGPQRPPRPAQPCPGPARVLLCPGRLKGLCLPSPPARGACETRGALAL